MTYDTDYYLSAISKRSNKFGSQLQNLMTECSVDKLSDVTCEQAKKFYRKLVDNKVDDSKRYKE